MQCDQRSVCVLEAKLGGRPGGTKGWLADVLTAQSVWLAAGRGRGRGPEREPTGLLCTYVFTASRAISRSPSLTE